MTGYAETFALYGVLICSYETTQNHPRQIAPVAFIHKLRKPIAAM